MNNNKFEQDVKHRNIRVNDFFDAIELIREYDSHDVLSYLFSIEQIEDHIQKRRKEMIDTMVEYLQAQPMWKETGDAVVIDESFFSDILHQVVCFSLKDFKKRMSSPKLVSNTEVEKTYELFESFKSDTYINRRT